MAQNSAFSELFLQVQDRIKTQVTDIRMVDEDKGQLESYDEKTGKPPVSWPCVLIGFENVTADNMGDLTQMINGTLVLRLGFPPFSYASSWAPDLATKEKALKYFDYEWQIYKALHGWTPEHFDTLAFRAADTERREDPIRVRVLRYEIGFEEYSAEPAHTTIAKPTMVFTPDNS